MLKKVKLELKHLLSYKSITISL